MRYTLEKSEIYAEIKREMERYRDYAINKSEEEIKAIYVKYPRIKEIDMELKNAGAHMLKETLRRRGEDRDKLVKEFKEHYANLENEKQAILNSAGISPDMLKPKFRCRLCEDTGIYKDKECKCMKKRRIEKMYTLSNIHENMKEQNFEKFNSSLFSKEPILNNKLLLSQIPTYKLAYFKTTHKSRKYSFSIYTIYVF